MQVNLLEAYAKATGIPREQALLVITTLYPHAELILNLMSREFNKEPDKEIGLNWGCKIAEERNLPEEDILYEVFRIFGLLSNYSILENVYRNPAGETRPISELWQHVRTWLLGTYSEQEWNTYAKQATVRWKLAVSAGAGG